MLESGLYGKWAKPQNKHVFGFGIDASSTTLCTGQLVGGWIGSSFRLVHINLSTESAYLSKPRLNCLDTSWTLRTILDLSGAYMIVYNRAKVVYDLFCQSKS